MFLIKPCPSCGIKIRFPIDRGRLKVKCRCGFSFTADPDAPSLYSDGKIDPSAGPARGFFYRIDDFFEDIDFTNIKEKIINAVLGFKYSLQNFSLMPTREKIIFLTRIAAVMIIIILLITVIMRLSCGAPSGEELII